MTSHTSFLRTYIHTLHPSEVITYYHYGQMTTIQDGISTVRKYLHWYGCIPPKTKCLLKTKLTMTDRRVKKVLFLVAQNNREFFTGLSNRKSGKSVFTEQDIHKLVCALTPSCLTTFFN